MRRIFSGTAGNLGQVRNVGRVRAVAPLLVAAVLAVVAVLTVARAGCDDPGRFVPVPGGYQLIGGCLDPDDLVVPAADTPPTRPTTGDANRS